MLSNSSILELADEAQGWKAGDRLVVASTDYSMHQAEEFDVMHCPACAPNQVKVQGQSFSQSFDQSRSLPDRRLQSCLLKHACGKARSVYAMPCRAERVWKV